MTTSNTKIHGSVIFDIDSWLRIEEPTAAAGYGWIFLPGLASGSTGLTLEMVSGSSY